jgi:hypothetical protein
VRLDIWIRVVWGIFSTVIFSGFVCFFFVVGGELRGIIKNRFR